MKMLKILVVSCIFIFLFGCAYSVPSTIAPAVNIYSSYEDKIQGTVVLVIDDSVNNISQEVKPSSYVCGAHKYPVRLDSALAISIKQTTDALFENVIEQNNLPSKEHMQKLNSQGVIFIKLNRFFPKISFSMGFWSGHANASCDIVLDVVVKDMNNRNLVTTSVGGSRSADGDSGINCGNGANVLSDAIAISIRDTMERYAERISNSEKIRNAFKISETSNEMKESRGKDTVTGIK
jgi:hypothetical protein